MIRITPTPRNSSPPSVYAKQSSNLLLALDSTVILGFGPCWESWPYFRPFQDHLGVSKWGLYTPVLSISLYGSFSDRFNSADFMQLNSTTISE
jgi:hypothetical protein